MTKHNTGFTIARRGYDTDEVDLYLAGLAAGGRPADRPMFTIRRRGYDRAQVDGHLAEIEPAPGPC
ncbi:DivIVA domain-containing protein [Yinghuangia sp. ASG 101]|uniref:DivIVA domain-containing protein n=1 Tax=Yinghuangia sp. ASG 101 TaxID=2896848 RepID=UPI001E4FD021|nr:DivIVA domain-containing protein [Yinghuangia sp. ASG 101]UGQ10430.1 DivIVA domain-containing protein [Yinghuangia sp. ASG 101]